ncbi:MAG: ribosome maturation factor RimM [Pseudomonadales bacterium]
MNELLLGGIAGVHGVKGWVRVHSRTHPVEAIFGYSPWTLRQGGDSREVGVLAHRVQGKKLLAQLEGITDRDQAEALRDSEILMDKDRLPALAEGDFYWFQLEGLAVKNTDGVVFGRVHHLLETGANDVLVVRPTDVSLDDTERLIPYTGQVVKTVDQQTSEIVVDWDAAY